MQTIIFKIRKYLYIYRLYFTQFTFFQGDYASVDAMQKKAASDKDPDQMLYAELGAGGGRKGPKSEPMESNYAQVKVDEMGYPARGPASDMSEPRNTLQASIVIGHEETVLHRTMVDWMMTME